MAKKVKGFIKKHDPAEARGKDAKMPRAHQGHFDPLKPLVKKSKSETGVGIRGEHQKKGKVKAAIGAKGKVLAKAHKSLPTKKKKKK